MKTMKNLKNKLVERKNPDTSEYILDDTIYESFKYRQKQSILIKIRAVKSEQQLPMSAGE